MDSGRHTAIALWQSYEDATRSKHGWAISKSLRKLAEEVEVEVEPEEMPERYEVGYIKAAGWHKMVGDHRDFGQLLTVVEKAWERELNRGSGEAAALRAASLALEDKLKRWGVGDYFCSPLVPAMAVEVSAVFA